MSSRLKLWLQFFLIIALTLVALTFIDLSWVFDCVVIIIAVVSILLLREEGIIVLRPPDISDERDEGDYRRLDFPYDFSSEVDYFALCRVDNNGDFVIAKPLNERGFYAIYVRRFVFEILLGRDWRYFFDVTEEGYMKEKCAKMNLGGAQKMTRPKMVFVKKS